MIFFSYWFALFLVAFFGSFWLVCKPSVRQLLLLAGCIAFHAHFAGPAGVIPIVALGVITYACGRIGGRIAPVVGVAACVIALITYKYTLFLAAGVLGLVSADFGSDVEAIVRDLLPAAPPLAISFFVFEFVHYLIDVRQGAPRIGNPRDFAVFAVFWPSLVAGPIKRYQQFLPELARGVTSANGVDVVTGMLRVSLGIVKKVAADYLGQMIGFWDSHLDLLPHTHRIAVVVAIGFRILLDFSGYSDMAIGFARMMGIRLPENFRWPYLATNLVDFWQRWHISLSTWIRDYIYIPLGGGRYGNTRRILNGAIAFALCGLWHGAGWNFILWGLYHGAGFGVSVAALHLERRIHDRIPAIIRRAGRIGGWAVTTTFVMIGWLLFFYPVHRALDILRLCVLG
jgi:alginate O-acetyltransferase complex protein AlgI